MSQVIGIDLGTTNSCVAVFDGAKVKIIPNREGANTTPSVVAFTESGLRIVGLPAKRQALTNPANTFYGVKRLIGRRFSDPEIAKDRKLLAYEVAAAGNGDAWLKASGQLYPPAQISAYVLQKMAETAEAYLGYPVTRAVITVPAYFNDAQRQATKAAGMIAGLDVLRIISEPTAAALAYGFERDTARVVTSSVTVTEPAASTNAVSAKTAKAERRGLLGRLFWKKDTTPPPPPPPPPRTKVVTTSKVVHSFSGTIAVYDLGGGTFDISILECGEGVYEVKSTAGDTHLGGDDFDERLLAFFCSTFKQQTGVDLMRERTALQRLREAAENAKIELSASQRVTVSLPFIITPAGTSVPLHFKCEVTRAQLDGMVNDLVERTLELCRRALGDAGLEAREVGKVILVGGMTRMPAVQEAVRRCFGREPLRDVNPDEAVAAGAAIQGAIMAGEVRSMMLLDVTPLSLGIELKGRVFERMIKRNTTIPTKKLNEFTTVEDSQQSVTIRVFQGEREMANDNEYLGSFELLGIPPAAAGTPKIEVTFDLDGNGILHVSAKDKGTGNERGIRIGGVGGLTETQIKACMVDAKAHRDSDQKARELAETTNIAEHALQDAGKILTQEEYAALDPDRRAQLSKAAEDLQAALRRKQIKLISAYAISLARLVSELREKARPVAVDTNSSTVKGLAGSSSSRQRHQIFMSYAREDEAWVQRLQRFLAVLRQNNELSLWIDRDIETGDEWQDRINQAIDNSSGAILLVSDKFLSSSFILKSELPKLLDARKRRGLYIIPILVTYCPYQHLTELNDIQIFNDPQRPFTSIPEWEVDKELTRLMDEIAVRLKDA